MIRVYYEDTDLGGIVYHANYIKFCERDRSEKFFAQGITPHFDGGEFVAAHIDASFKAPSHLGDILEVKTKILELKGSSLILSQKVFKDETLLFDMKITLVFVKKLKPARMSAQIKEQLHEIFQS
jgi:acyl-CoA thioester hydrolase